MLHRKIYVLVVVLIISACTGLQMQRESLDQLKINKDNLDTRWIDVNHGPCTIRLLSFSPGHLRLSVASKPNPANPCEPGVEPLPEAIATAAKKLMDSHAPAVADKMHIEIDLSSQPTLVKRWASYLKQSPQWQNRPKQKNPWDTSEYKLITLHLQDSLIFESYAPIYKKFPAYPKHHLQIEKVDYRAASEWPYFESDLRPMGYAPQERIPLPLMITLVMEK